VAKFASLRISWCSIVLAADLQPEVVLERACVFMCFWQCAVATGLPLACQLICQYGLPSSLSAGLVFISVKAELVAAVQPQAQHHVSSNKRLRPAVCRVCCCMLG
jgi:hypothetical protein